MDVLPQLALLARRKRVWCGLLVDGPVNVRASAKVARDRETERERRRQSKRRIKSKGTEEGTRRRRRGKGRGVVLTEGWSQMTEGNAMERNERDRDWGIGIIVKWRCESEGREWPQRQDRQVRQTERQSTNKTAQNERK